ncbi:cupin domain-containing protein [Microbacterium sp. PMB16]|uniref:cupin domain-containing protein n=1 Tax=Microbacterium sp. PMB16 TaxID=3120157 RepID=UPI003F4C7B59
MHRTNIFDTALPPAPDTTPRRYAAGMLNISMLSGSEMTGMMLTELSPGQSHAPYHYELALDKWMLVVEGSAVARTPAGREPLRAGDLLFLPPGPEGALQIDNESTDVVRLLFFSNVTFPCVTIYPDSDKVGVWTKDGAQSLIVERTSAVGYFHNEA